MDYLSVYPEAFLLFRNALISFTVCVVLYSLSRAIAPKVSTKYHSLPEFKREQWHITFVSAFPAVFVPPGAIMAYRDLSWDYSDVLTTTSPWLPGTVGLSVGYMFFDFCAMCSKPKLFRRGMGPVTYWLFLLHHLFSFSLWPWATLAARGTFFVNWFLLTEMSNILMHIRWFMISTDCTDGLPYIVLSLTWTALFFVLRIAPIPTLISMMWHGDWSKFTGPEFWVTVTCVPIPMLLNAYWMTLIFLGIAQFCFSKKNPAPYSKKSE